VSRSLKHISHSTCILNKNSIINQLNQQPKRKLTNTIELAKLGEINKIFAPSFKCTDNKQIIAIEMHVFLLRLSIWSLKGIIKLNKANYEDQCKDYTTESYFTRLKDSIK
jgi:hypothetical protein